jgi:hypothetical protein
VLTGGGAVTSSWRAAKSSRQVVAAVLHWNGKKWTQISVPNPAGTKVGSLDELTNLSCTSATSCLTVGFAEHLAMNGKSLNQLLRWNGKKWLKQEVPNPDGTGPSSDNGLLGITCASARDCWAVGVQHHSDGDDQDNALHWTGTKWQVG